MQNNLIDNNISYIGVSEAAEVSGMKPGHFHYYMKSGRTPQYIIIAGKKLFNREDFNEWKPALLKRGRPVKKKGGKKNESQESKEGC